MWSGCFWKKWLPLSETAQKTETSEQMYSCSWRQFSGGWSFGSCEPFSSSLLLIVLIYACINVCVTFDVLRLADIFHLHDFLLFVFLHHAALYVSSSDLVDRHVATQLLDIWYWPKVQPYLIGQDYELLLCSVCFSRICKMENLKHLVQRDLKTQ